MTASNLNVNDYMKDDQDEADNKCEVCPLAAEKSCSACYSVSYCSVEHQKLDWKNHKKNCNAYKVETTEELGVHLVASRDLKAGTLVLKECPVSIGPKVPASISEEETDVLLPFPLCLGCYAIIMGSKEESRKCSKCKWPICSVSCEKISYHAENECEHFAKNNVKYSVGDYSSILILRMCLMKHKDLSKWSSVLKLQHEPSLGRDKLSVQKNKERAKKLLEIFKLSDKVSVDDWIRVSNAVDINALEVYVIEHGKSGQAPRRRMGLILTLKGSMLSHSCSPNCSWSVSAPSSDMTMQVRTSVDVVKGEVLTITYNPELNAIGTLQRRKAIRHFLCKCTRCEDPTELGSNFSTLVCPKCHAPQLISTNPLDESSPWQCGSCTFMEMNALRKIGDLVSTFENSKEEHPKKIQALISKYSGTHLHQNHWLLVKAIKGLIISFDKSRRTQELEKPERELYISSEQQLLKVASILTPGISKERAHLQKMLSKEILSHAMLEHSCKNLSLIEFQKQLKLVEDLQEEAYKFFKADCEETESGKKSPWVEHLDEQIKLVKYVYRGGFTLQANK